MDLEKIKTLSEIKQFLEGSNDELKYLVNVEASNKTNYANCFIHEPGQKPRMIQVKYHPFLYFKDLKANGVELYADQKDLIPQKMIQYGLTHTRLETGNQKRLMDGFCFKMSSNQSFQAILDFFKDGGVDPYGKLKNKKGKLIKNKKGEDTFLYRNLFYNVKPYEQFMMANKCRLFKGIEEYKDVHRVTFDIETGGLRFERSRVFAIGIRDNRGFETIIKAEVLNNDNAERDLIIKFFKIITDLNPAIIAGFNSENFDFEFILGRAEILEMDIKSFKTTINDRIPIQRRKGATFKHGSETDHYTSTQMWGTSVVDILHAVKKTAAINSDIKEHKLKYIAKFEKIAKPDRMYIEGDKIFKFFEERKVFLINTKNEYIKIPDKFQTVGLNLYKLQENKDVISSERYKSLKSQYLTGNDDFIDWFKEYALPTEKIKFISGNKIVERYLLDDLWETEGVDEIYNQSSFLLAKIVPTIYSRISTMGTAGIWNLLMTAWSYEKGIAIPCPDVDKRFGGGLVRCYKVGFYEYFVKIDYAGLYPMLQLSNDIFPIFDYTGGMRKMLLYSTTVRNIYKKLANSDNLNEEEVFILKEIDHDAYHKFITNTLTSLDRAIFKIKQLPIKILNNSQFGALGSNVAYNWSDNVCAGRITCLGRLELRHAVDWFTRYNCTALYAVTDGINFGVPKTTKIIIGENILTPDTTSDVELDINTAWQYNGKTGISALIEKYNTEQMKSSFMSVDNDGEFASCINLKKLNYATLSITKDKKTGEMKEKIKLTGNSIKSKVMPEYCNDFYEKGLNLILHNKGSEFIDYYQEYVQDIYYKRIPLKKIANKTKFKKSLHSYLNRGNDKNGKKLAVQAHMELLIEKRNSIALDLFEEHKANLVFTKNEEDLTLEEKFNLVSDYMPPEPELDTLIYHINNGYTQSNGHSSKVIDKITGQERYSSSIITQDELDKNPNMLGEYNVKLYLAAFNKKVKPILIGFDPEIAKKILAKVVKKKEKDALGKKITIEKLEILTFNDSELQLKCYDSDTIEESMYLEKSEIDYWNENGYDPRLTFNGFKTPEDNKIHYEVYEEALKYLNDKMISVNKPLIKTMNDKYSKGDLVLLKRDFIFTLAEYNGEYLNIIKQIENLPKTEYQIKVETDRAKLIERNRLIASGELVKTDAELIEEDRIAVQDGLRRKYYMEFLESLDKETDISFEEFINDDVAIELDEYIADIELFEEKTLVECGMIEQ